MTFIDIAVGSLFIFGGLYFDLSSHKEHQQITFKNALHWSIFWVVLSLTFAGYIYFARGFEAAQIFVTAYVLEKSLSVDNIMVWSAILFSFGLFGALKSDLRHRILYWGILGAIVLRMLFVGFGVWLVELSPYVLVAFGGIILFTAYLMYSSGEDDEGVDYTTHWATKWADHVWHIDPSIESGKFFVRTTYSTSTVPVGSVLATPLFLCLVVIEVSDIIFAFDSVPTVVAVARDPYIAFMASILAVLGLRSMFFLLDAAKDALHYLEPAVIVVLVGIGVKIIAEGLGMYHVETAYNLMFVGVVLGVGVAASLLHEETPSVEG